MHVDDNQWQCDERHTRAQIDMQLIQNRHQASCTQGNEMFWSNLTDTVDKAAIYLQFTRPTKSAYGRRLNNDGFSTKAENDWRCGKARY